MKTILRIFILAIVLAAPGFAFEEKQERYLSPHDIFRTLQNRFDLADFSANTFVHGCQEINSQNKYLIGTRKESNGEYVFPGPSAAFVKWYSKCLKIYIQEDIKNTLQTKDGYRRYISPEAINDIEKTHALGDAKEMQRQADQAYGRNAAIHLIAFEKFLKSLTLKNIPYQNDEWSRGELLQVINIMLNENLAPEVLQSLITAKSFIASRKITGTINATKTAEYVVSSRVRIEEFSKRRTPLDLNKAVSILGPVTWKKLALTTKLGFAIHLIHRFIGPGVLNNENEMAQALLSTLETEIKNDTTLLSAAEQLTFLVCTQDEFLSY